ncbi:hypothetical protein QTO34_013507 [Cnephaeus nilssonii]|uniref:Uncharacterized protein n=1 Tax=Cnephaeus nilssonii TaxID=3371016 RepID=A0AA40LSR4_CNENI|nr:hypothetical protein QTO34_013507 [Eptesicus nilssonii]
MARGGKPGSCELEGSRIIQSIAPVLSNSVKAEKGEEAVEEKFEAIRSHYLRNTFHQAIAAIDNDFSNEWRLSKLKTFWERFTI